MKCVLKISLSHGVFHDFIRFHTYAFSQNISVNYFTVHYKYTSTLSKMEYRCLLAKQTKKWEKKFVIFFGIMHTNTLLQYLLYSYVLHISMPLLTLYMWVFCVCLWITNFTHSEFRSPYSFIVRIIEGISVCICLSLSLWRIWCVHNSHMKKLSAKHCVLNINKFAYVGWHITNHYGLLKRK